MESAPTQSHIGNHVLDRRIRTTLSTAKITLCEVNLTFGTIHWSVDQSFHFFEFSKSYDGTIDGYFDLIHLEDKHKVKSVFENIEHDNNITFIHRVLWTDGSYRWLEYIGKFYIENGVSILIGTIQDITDRKLLELDRADWERRHKLVADSAGIIVYDYNINTGSILWSGNLKEILSFSENEMGDINRWGELIHPEDRKEAFRLLEEAQSQLKTYEVYYRFRRKDGEYRNMYDKGTFISKEGKAIRMLGMMSDVTEMMQSKMALAESENRFKSLMNSLNVGVGLYDLDMVPIVHNKAAYTLLGMSEESFTGKAATDPDWNVVDSDGQPMNPNDFPIPRCISSKRPVGQVVMGVYRPLYKDRVWLMVDAEPIFDESNNLLNIICTYSDFSIRRHMEETLREKNRQLIITSEEIERRNERLLEFAQIVSHNLRSPLSSIAGLTELYFSAETDQQNQAVKYIQDVCSKALETIEDLNEVLKVQQDERLEKTEVSFEETIRSVKELLKITVMKKEAVVETNFDLAPTITYPAVFIENILLNLLSNAIKYSKPDDKPKIRLTTEKQGKDIVLNFVDNGIGINLSKHKADIFSFGKTFHKNKNSKGVGLFLVKNQIRTMGDEIEVESEINKGTRFTITFKNQYNGKGS